MLRLLIFRVTLGVRAVRAVSSTREGLVIENMTLRQQVTALNKKLARPALDAGKSSVSALGGGPMVTTGSLP